MSDQPKIKKWPFYLADLVLVAITGYLFYLMVPPRNAWEASVCGVALVVAGVGAYLSIKPYLVEHQSATDLARDAKLASAMEQLERLEEVANRIGNATVNWQGVHEASNKTIAAAKEIAERMNAEGRDFMQFLENANNQEKQHLRLEIEKMRRGEGEWLQVCVRILDHVFALYVAAVRSGQPALMTQIGQFQNACRDATRRMGLNTFAPQPGELLDLKNHQPNTKDGQAPAEARIAETLALGFTYQGQLIRKSLVSIRLEGEGKAGETPASTEQEEKPSGTEKEEEAVDEEGRVEASGAEEGSSNRTEAMIEAPERLKADQEAEFKGAEIPDEEATREVVPEMTDSRETADLSEKPVRRGRPKKPNPQVDLPF
ncbi:MAG: hypothetical protein SFY81_03425 [Verrucomicrobiota bacterium]|nr:hypothetical protein [Verrucomicrobiota bacterium]